MLGAVDAVRAAQDRRGQYLQLTPYVVASLLFILMSAPFPILLERSGTRNVCVSANSAEETV